MSFITGNAKDFEDAKKSQTIKVLQTRHHTRKIDLKEDSHYVKQINGNFLKEPNLTTYKPYKPPRPATMMEHSRKK